MALSKTKLKSDLREKLQEEEESKGKPKGSNDPRYLPFYQMEERETMKIVFVADPNGDLYTSYRKHGGNIKVPGIKPINCCYTSSGESCPVCQLSYQYYQEEGKGSANAQMWRGQNHFITQCIPIESNIEIPETVDDNGDLTNIVKLMALPFKVKEKIDEAIISGEVNDPTEIVFVLKKNKNDGGYATYEHSYFLHKDLEDIVPSEIFEAADQGLVQPYDLQEELPAATTTEEVQEWLDDALEKIANAEKTKNKTKNVKSKVSEKLGSKQDDDDDDNDEPKSSGGSGESQQDKSLSDQPASSRLREKLAQRNKR